MLLAIRCAGDKCIDSSHSVVRCNYRLSGWAQRSDAEVGVTWQSGPGVLYGTHESAIEWLCPCSPDVASIDVFRLHLHVKMEFSLSFHNKVSTLADERERWQFFDMSVFYSTNTFWHNNL